MGRLREYFPKGSIRRGQPDRQSAAANLEAATVQLCRSLAALSEQELQNPPSAGRWAPAQIADHLILTNQRLCGIAERAMAGKPPPAMPKGLLSDEGRPLAPEVVAPRAGRSAEELVADAADSARRLTEVVSRAEAAGLLEATCLRHAFFGDLTVLECLQMAAWHVKHHLVQLEDAAPTSAQRGAS